MQRISARRAALVAAGLGLVTGCASQPQGVQSDVLVSIRTELAAAEAQNSIRSLMHAYGRLIDARDFEAFAKLWTDDAVYVGGPKGEQLVGGQWKFRRRVVLGQLPARAKPK